jgi:hypothetical protein
MYASCPVEPTDVADSLPKIAMSKFFRAGSLLRAHGLILPSLLELPSHGTRQSAGVQRAACSHTRELNSNGALDQRKGL